MESSKVLNFNDLENIESFTCMLGLKFPEHGSDFQKAFLTLAHLMAAAREYVLKGHEVPTPVCELILDLAMIIGFKEHEQK